METRRRKAAKRIMDYVVGKDSWKGKLLVMGGRLVLINSVIQNTCYDYSPHRYLVGMTM
jgi:hypothetical protein